MYTIAYQTLPFVEMEKWIKKPQKWPSCCKKKSISNVKQKSQKHYLVLYQLKNYILFSASLCVQGKKWINLALSFHLPQNRFKKRIYNGFLGKKRVTNLVPEIEYYFLSNFQDLQNIACFSSTTFWHELHWHLPFHPGGALGIYSCHPVWLYLFYKLSYDFARSKNCLKQNWQKYEKQMKIRLEAVFLHLNPLWSYQNYITF